MNGISRIIIALFLMAVASQYGWALEIDEKLTTRFLKISATNRTVLINRGLEDGLVVGDHAKFFLTTGVIARGVVVKVSPTRSIWSIYRIVNRDKLYKDLAVNLKITKPVEITEDPTKSIYVSTVQTNVQVMRGDKDKMAMGDDQLPADEQDELQSMEDLGTLSTGMGKAEMDHTRSWEAFGLINFSSSSGIVDEGGGQQFTSEGLITDFTVGVEKYFTQSRGFLQQLSVFGLIHRGSYSMTSLEGQKIEGSVFEYGGGFHYHFLSSPFAINRFIPFAGASFGLGSVSTQTTFIGNNVAGINGEVTEGSNNFWSLGLGAKYYTRSGFGFRAILDFYNRNETYTFEDTTQSSSEVTRSLSGPRIQLGLAYRW